MELERCDGLFPVTDPPEVRDEVVGMIAKRL
jgi:hypothetical protein